MVERIFELFNKKINGLHEAAYLLGIFAFLSQLLAILRDRVLVGDFGVGHTLDMYYASFEIPDFLFATVASLVSLSVLVPFITERLAKSDEETKKFINTLFSFFFVMIISVCALAFLFMPFLVPHIFPGVPDKATLITMARIMLCSPILLGISNFVASITQVGKRFLVYALSPLFYNFGIILGAVFLYPVFGIYGLSFGVILGALMHLGIQLPFVFRTGLLKIWPFHFDLQMVKRVFLISIPRTITLGMTQITTLALVSMASVMSAGSIAVFNFSSNLQAVPLSIIGVSYSLAAFPTLAHFITRKETDKFLSHIGNALRHAIFWAIPVSVLFIVLRAQIVRTIYGTGQFNWNDTRLTAAALAIFALSVVAQALVLIFIRGYYAMGNTKKSWYAGLLTGVLAIGFSFLFSKLFVAAPFFRSFIESMFRVQGIPGTEALMLPLGFSLAQIVNCAVLWLLFEKEWPGVSGPLLRTLFQSFSAAVIMGFVSYLGLNVFDNIFNINTVIGIFLQGLCAGTIGIIVAIAVLKLLKSRELEETAATLHHKFWKSEPIAPDINAADL